jgi:hypothetical protein
VGWSSTGDGEEISDRVKNGFLLPLGLKKDVGFWGAGVFCADLDDSGAE